MNGLFWLIILISLGMLGGVIYFVLLLKRDEERITPDLLYTVIKIAFGVFLVVYLISLGITVWGMQMSEAMFAWFIKIIIYLIIFSYMFKYARELLHNLSKDEIFIDENYHLTKHIGVLFLNLAITELLAGFFLDIIDLLGGGSFSFNVTTNFSIFVFVIFGILLILVSKILQKAIEIHNENELTI